MPFHRRILPLATLAALTALALPAAATAAPRGRAARAVVLNVVRVDIRGDLTAVLNVAPESFTYEGSARYETSDDRGGTLRIASRPPIASLAIKGLEYNGISDVTLKNETDDTWRCGIPTPDAQSPTGLSAMVFFTRTHARFSWVLMNPPYRCAVNSGAPSSWSIPAMPSTAYTQYPLKKLKGLKKGKTLRMPVRLSEDFELQDGTYAEYNWNGYVEFERVR